MRQIIVIAHNLRSAHNIGSLLRTAEGLGVQKVFLTGYTPYPLHASDRRLPHLAQKTHKQIQKTALDAEVLQPWEQANDIYPVIQDLKAQGYHIIAIEQSPNSVSLPDLKPPEKCALVLGREVEGIEPEVLDNCDIITEIPMFGSKESFNVVQAAAMALYHFRFS